MFPEFCPKIKYVQGSDNNQKFISFNERFDYVARVNTIRAKGSHNERYVNSFGMRVVKLKF